MTLPQPGGVGKGHQPSQTQEEAGDGAGAALEQGQGCRLPAAGKPLEGGHSALSWVVSASPSGAASEKALLARDWKEKGNFSWLRGLCFLCFGNESVFSPHCEAGAGLPSACSRGGREGGLYTQALVILLPVQSPLKFARKCRRPHQPNSPEHRGAVTSVGLPAAQTPELSAVVSRTLSPCKCC